MALALQQLVLPETPANEAPSRTRRWRSPDARTRAELAPARTRIVVYSDIVGAASPSASVLLERTRSQAIAAGFRVGRIEHERWSAVLDAHDDVVGAIASAVQIGAVVAEHGARIGLRMFVHVDRSVPASGPTPRIPAELDASIASQPEPGLWVGAAARRLVARR